MSIWLAVSSIAFLIQLAYWSAFHLGFRKALTAPRRGDARRGVSVLVAAHNEQKNLPDLLASLAPQCVGERELIVVDDDSADSTPSILHSAADMFASGHLRVVTMRETAQPRKKRALTAGIAAASYPILLFTDADCVPGPGWIDAMLESLPDSPDGLIVGYSPFAPRRGFLNLVARYETFVTGYATAAAIGLGHPFMAVGRNIAYTRTLFDAVDGFSHSLHVLSGDDDLFVQHVAANSNAPIVHAFSPASFVRTEAPDTWRSWIRQKLRHTSAGKYYAAATKRHLAAYHSSAITLWVAAVFGPGMSLALLLLRQLVQFGALVPGARRLGETRLLVTQPLLELTYILYNTVLAPLGVVLKRRRWN